MVQYETNDGWDLENIQPLSGAVDAYDDMANLIYELKNCRRQTSLQDIRDRLRNLAQEIINSVDEIEDDDEVIEKKDE